MDIRFELFALPAELRIAVYEALLIQDGSLDPFTNTNNRPRYRILSRDQHLNPAINPVTFRQHRILVPNILSTNSTVFREANSILYRKNTFNFTSLELERIPEFFHDIGAAHTSQIQHVRVDFPVIETDEGNFYIGQYDCDILQMISTHCGNLKSVTIALESASLYIDWLARLCDPSTLVTILSRVDSLLKSMPSVKQPEVVIELPKQSLSFEKKEVILQLGWKIKEISLKPRSAGE